MAKADLTFDRFDLTPAFRKPSRPAWVGNKKVNGWDTETADGSVFLLTVCFAERDPEAIHADGGIVEPETVLRWLTHREARGALNVWYNLDFDANVILSALPRENLFELVVTNQTVWEGYDILYIPAKVLTIRHAKHRYDHFDVSQFFFGSLDNASREWVGAGKEKGNLDLTRFGDADYRRTNWSEILHYAKIDAKRTRDLFSAFAQAAESVGVPCGRPYSTGYLGEQAMNVKFQKSGKPGFSFTAVQEMAWEAYRGGRFEVVERGAVGDVVTVDINSAYPDVLRSLPDPGTLRWRKAVSPSLDEIGEADYGFVEAWVTTDPARPLQPFPIRAENKLQFPALTDARVVSIKSIFEHAVSVGIITDYRIGTAWLGYATPHTVRPFVWLEELYALRQQYKREGKDKAQMVLKIIINSVYGKLCQLTESTNFADGESDSPDFFPIDALPGKIRQWLLGNGLEIERTIRCGSYFNPFLAAHITGTTRLRLLESAISCGLEESVIMLATDSVMFRADDFKRTDFISRYGGSELGAWEIEGEGDAFVVGSGIYEIRQADGKVKARTRGFSEGFGVWMMDLADDGGLRAIAERTEGTVIPITTNRPLKIPQAIYQNFDLRDVGRFMDFPKGIRAGMDSKRVWPRGAGVTWRELLEGPERSAPKIFS